MSALDDIVLAPNEGLTTECARIEHIDGSTKKLAKKMLRDMYATDGCGLAAPQVGENVQLVVIDVDYSNGKKNPYVLVNPVVVTADGDERETGEGCLSFPGVTVRIKRPSHVVVQAQNLDGDLMQYEAKDNLLAVCLQHEIDHLHGVTMMDHLAPLERVRAMHEYEEALANGAKPGDIE